MDYVFPINLPGAKAPGQVDPGTTFAPQDPSLPYAQSVRPHYVEYFQCSKCCILQYQLQALQERLYSANTDKAKLQEENATQRRDRTLQNTQILVQKDCRQKLEKQLQDERLKAERQRLGMEETLRSIVLKAAESEKEVQRLQQEEANYEERLEGMQKQLEGLRKDQEKERKEAEKQRTEAEGHSRGLAEKVAESEQEVRRLQQENGDFTERLAKLHEQLEALKEDKLEQQKKIEEALSSLRTSLEEAWHKDVQRSSQSLFALEQRLEDAQGCIKLLLEAPSRLERDLQPEGPFAPETPRELKEATPVDFDAPKAGDQEPAKQRPSLGGRSHDSQGSTTAPEDEEDSRPDSFDIDDLEEQLQHAEAPSGREEDLQPEAAVEEVPQRTHMLHDDSVPEATSAPSMPKADSEIIQVCHSSDQSRRICEFDATSLPDELLSGLLDFLPVAEVAEMQTRAVSRFFGNPQVWVAHLFKLMDADSVLERSSNESHPVYEFLRYYMRSVDTGFESAIEIARNASEGFQGYRLWFNGHVKWHLHAPGRSSRFVKAAVGWFRCRKALLNVEVGEIMCHAFLCDGIRDLRLDIAHGLLAVLTEHSLSLPTCQLAMKYLEACHIAFPLLSKTFAVKFLELSVQWMWRQDESWKKLSSTCQRQIKLILDAILPSDEAHLASRCANAMRWAQRHGKHHEFEAKKHELMDLLSS